MAEGNKAGQQESGQYNSITAFHQADDVINLLNGSFHAVAGYLELRQPSHECLLNATGYPVSYMIHPHGNALMLMDEDDPAASRAQFTNYHLWVTPYAPDERYAAGDYPNQSEPGQGLPAWSADSRDIQNQDLVLWYTMGFHHVPSSKDWPVYSLGWHAVTLKPYNFFDRNPALDVPPVASNENPD